MLGVLREIALHHPRIIAGVDAQKHIGYGSSLVLAKVEHLYSTFVFDDSPCKIDVVVHAAVFGKKRDVVFQILRIHIQLRFKNFESGTRIGKGGMGILEVFAAIMLVGSDEGAAFELVVDVLDIDALAAHHV